MQRQLPRNPPELAGATVQPWYLFPVNQPNLPAFAARDSWRYQQTVTPFLDSIASGTPPVVTTGLDWIQSTCTVWRG
jgi:hypothetical protein